MKGFAWHAIRVFSAFGVTLLLTTVTGLAFFWGDKAPLLVQLGYLLGIPLMVVVYMTRPRG